MPGAAVRETIMQLHVLFEDNHCLAVLKPSGLLTQGVPDSIVTLESLARDYLRQRYAKQGRVYLGIPHRLDRPVSGVVLFARQTKSAQRIAEQFQNRQVQKTYWAAVEGEVSPAEGDWTDWLLKNAGESRSTAATPDTEKARRADLHYRRLASIEGGTLLELQPSTGRMHQLRVQSSLRGWPVRGDRHYGARLDFGPPVELERDRPIALHARSLTFLHPVRFEPITVTAPLPDTWQSLHLPAEFSP